MIIKRIKITAKNIMLNLSILSLLLVLISGVFISFEKSENNALAAAVSGGSVIGGAGTVTINKKYLYGTDENETITVNKGSIITVRVKYNNLSNFSYSGVKIKDALPAGLSYVPGSMKNCITPTVLEKMCDSQNSTNKNTMYAQLTGGVGISPVAGLYDGISGIAAGGTAPGASEGFLEGGKRKFMVRNQCNQVDQQSSTYIVSQTNGGTNTNAAANSGWLASEQCFPLRANTGSFRETEMVSGKRYSVRNECVAKNSTNKDYNASQSGFYTNTFSPLNTGWQTNELCYNYRALPTATRISDDMLGNRYSVRNHCTQTNAAGGNIYFVSQTYGYTNTFNNNNAGWNTNDLCYNQRLAGTSFRTTQDNADNTRGSGYFEYDLSTTGAAVGIYGTGVSLEASTNTGFNPLTTNATDVFDTSNNRIILTDPTPTVVSDLKFVSGASELNNIDIGPTDIFTARLNYSNTGNLPALGAMISSTIPSGFTILNSTFKNCLRPTIAETLCTSTFTPGGSVITGQNITISPNIGLYDISTNSTASQLNIGKSRYLKNYLCTNRGGNRVLDDLQLPGNNTFWGAVNNVTTLTTTNLSNLNGIDPCISLGGTQQQAPFDIFNNRYLKTYKCTGAGGNNNLDDNQIANISNLPALSTGQLATLNTANNCTTGGGVQTQDSFDLFAGRYIKQYKCTNRGGNFNLDDSYIPATGGVSENFKLDETIMANLDTANNCTTGGGMNIQTVFDTLDNTRSGGFIEFQLQASSTLAPGTYIQNSSISSTNATTVNDNGNITFLPGNINGKAFNDLNGNGQRDAGDTFMSGVTVALKKSSDNSTVATMTTGTGGVISFTRGLGVYYMEIISAPAGKSLTLKNIAGGTATTDSDFFQATGRSIVFTLNPGDTYNNIDAGFITGVDLSLRKSSLGGGDSQTGTIGRITDNSNVNYTLSVKNTDPTISTTGPITVTDTIPIARMNYVSYGGAGWVCTYSIPTLTCVYSAVIPPNSFAQPIYVNGSVPPGL